MGKYIIELHKDWGDYWCAGLYVGLTWTLGLYLWLRGPLLDVNLLFLRFHIGNYRPIDYEDYPVEES